MDLMTAVDLFCSEIHTVSMPNDHIDVDYYLTAANDRKPIVFEAGPGIKVMGDVYGVQYRDEEGTIEFTIDYDVVDDES